MKKRFILLITGMVICLGLLFYLHVSSRNALKENNIKNKNNFIAIMIKENGATEYTVSSSNSIPVGDYVLNEEKTICENGGKISDYNSETGKIKMSFLGADKCYLYFDYELPFGYISILNNNGGKDTIENKGDVDFDANATKLNEMFAIDDEYTPVTGNKSYYFRGRVTKNYLKFGKYITDGPIRGYKSATSKVNYTEYTSLEECNAATENNFNCANAWNIGDDIYWRVVRIAGDNSIKLLYHGASLPTEDTYKWPGTMLFYEKYNEEYNSAEYVGYQYILGNQHGYGEDAIDSNAKKVLDNWFIQTTFNTTDAALVADTIFCNDRTVSLTADGEYGDIENFPSSNTDYYYGAVKRIKGFRNDNASTPSLVCPDERDKFTVSNEKGNGALTYPVGLLTIDEVFLTGSVGYLRINGYRAKTISPAAFLTKYNSSRIYNIDDPRTGLNLTALVYNETLISPVISLSPEVKLTGTGTWDNPYEVVY